MTNDSGFEPRTMPRRGFLASALGLAIGGVSMGLLTRNAQTPAAPVAEPKVAALPPARLQDWPSLDALAQEMISARVVPGLSLSVMREGVSLYAKGFGLSDVQTKTPVTADTTFRIASITKQFTAAAILARLWVDTSGVEVPATVWFPAIDPKPFAATLAIALVGAGAGRLLKLPSPYFLGTMILGTVLHLGAGIDFQLPQWLLAVSYAAVGWAIGLNFTMPILRHATRALPQIVAAILVLIAICGGVAWLISRTLGIDPLTAYLATSPGGMDSIAIIAAAADNVDISFVMALQTVRFLIVLVLGPSMARLIARTVRE